MQKKGINNISPSSFGYALKDLDSDGSEELIWLREDYFVLAIFTIVDENAKLVDENAKLIGAYWYRNKGVVLEDGCIYNVARNGAVYFDRYILQLKSGDFSIVKQFGMNGDYYYEMCGNIEKKISKEAFDKLSETYPSLLSQNEMKMYMSGNGIEFVRLGCF